MNNENSKGRQPSLAWGNIQNTLDSCEKIFADHSAGLSKSVRLSSSVVLRACDTFSELHDAKNEIFNLLHSAAALQLSLGATGRVHVVIESELTEENSEELGVEKVMKSRRSVSVLPLFSPTLTISLLQSTRDPDEQNVFSAELIDLFAHAERIADKYKSALEEHHGLRKDDCLAQDPATHPPQEIAFVPDWFISNRYKRRKNKLTGKILEPPRGEDINVDYKLFCKIEKLPDKELESVYGNLFCTLHEAAKNSKDVQYAEQASHGVGCRSACPKSKKYSGAIVYYNWTPPWLRMRMNFMCGKRNDQPVRFELGYLPNKRWCRKKERRDLCRSILAEWLRREVSTRDILLRELAKRKIFISEEDLSNFEHDRTEIGVENTHSAPMDDVFEKRNQHNIERDVQNVAQSTSKTVIIPEKHSAPAHAAVEDAGGIADLTTQSTSSDVILVEMGGEKLRAEDIETLKPGRWLNSTVINAFFSLLGSASVLILNSWFFTILENGNEGEFAHLAGWVTRKNLEQVRVILVPVHSERFKHWALVAIDKPTATIQLYDSMPGLCAFVNATTIIGNWCSFLKDYLRLETWPRHWSASPKLSVSRRQQNNNDCGVFACVNAFLLSQGSSADSFPSSNTSLLRKRIENSILAKRLQIKDTEYI